VQIQGGPSMDIRSQSSASPAHRIDASETRDRAYAISGRGDAISKSVATAAMSFISQQLGVAVSSITASVGERINQMATLLTSFMMSAPVDASPASNSGGIKMVSMGSASAAQPAATDFTAITDGLTKTWDNVATNLETRGNAFAMDNGKLIVAGSTNATSDRDLTFVAAPTTQPMSMREGATQLADTKAFWSKQWVAASQDKTPPTLAGKVGVDPDVRKTPMNDSERLNTMKALQQSGSNWFTAIEKYSKDPNDPSMLRNLRALEVEFTHSMSTAIMANCDNVSESAFVKLINQGSQDVFGKELGTVFDTNIYTAHSILKSGVTITNKESKAELMDANATKGLMKVAKNIIALHHGDIKAGKLDFDSLMERSCKGLDTTKKEEVQRQFEKAFDGALVQETSIKDKMVEIKTSLQTDLASLTLQIDTASDVDKPVLMAKLDSLNQVLKNDSELEMVAMNRLYEAKLTDAQATFNTMGEIEATVQSAISYCVKDNPQLAKDLLSAFQKGDFATIETRINAGGIAKADAGILLAQLGGNHLPYEKAVVASVSAQMEALVYANEPYYSQATVDGVVGGIQMDRVHEGMDDSARLKTKLDGLSEKFPVLKEPETWGSCMQENFGDFAKDKHHYESEPGNFLFKGSKYLFRMAFSAQVALELKGVSDDSRLKKQVGVLREVSADLQKIRGNPDSGDKKVEACRQRLLQSAADLGLEMKADTPIDKVAERLYELSKQVMVDCSVLLNK
jgi:hypothetical protein